MIFIKELYEQGSLQLSLVQLHSVQISVVVALQSFAAIGGYQIIYFSSIYSSSKESKWALCWYSF